MVDVAKECDDAILRAALRRGCATTRWRSIGRCAEHCRRADHRAFRTVLSYMITIHLSTNETTKSMRESSQTNPELDQRLISLLVENLRRSPESFVGALERSTKGCTSVIANPVVSAWQGKRTREHRSLATKLKHFALFLRPVLRLPHDLAWHDAHLALGNCALVRLALIGRDDDNVLAAIVLDKAQMLQRRRHVLLFD